MNIANGYIISIRCLEIIRTTCSLKLNKIDMSNSINLSLYLTGPPPVTSRTTVLAGCSLKRGLQVV